jgi:hypothetical protein
MRQIPNRTRWFTVRMTDEEYDAVDRFRAESTCTTLSEYARRVLLRRPVVVRKRNQSLDDFMADMLPFMKDLEGIYQTFCESNERLAKLGKTSDIQQWILVNEQDKTQLFRQLETIKNHIIKANTQWSRE